MTTTPPYPVDSTTERNWIFGYGSIISEASRRATLAEEDPPPAALVELLPEAGYVREWNFRAPSGFTAVGLRASDTPTPVCGVLFEAAGRSMRACIRVWQMSSWHEPTYTIPSASAPKHSHQSIAAVIR